MYKAFSQPDGHATSDATRPTRTGALLAGLPPDSPLLKELERRGNSRHGTDDDADDNADDAASVSVSESDAVSEALSAMSALDADDVVPIDSERYARICGRIERLQHAVGRRDVKAREAKAKLREQRRCVQSMRSELAALRGQVDSLSSRVARESAAKEEAVDRAAAALVERERLLDENEQLRQRERVVAAQLRTQHEASAQIGGLQLKSSEEVRDLRAQLSAVALERRELEAESRGIRAHLDEQQRRVSELAERNAVLEQQVESMREGRVQSDLQLEIQSAQLSEARQDVGRLRVALEAEREENTRHIARLLERLIRAEDELAGVRATCSRGEESSAELRESILMLNEELLHNQRRFASAEQSIAGYQEQLQVSHRARHEAARQCRELDASRRRMLAVFAPARKHLSSIDAAMAQLCVELQRVGKTIAVGRCREAALGQALREYGRRNRELQTGLSAAKQKLRTVTGALRSSEKRKSVAVASSATLKRDLVAEKCQRSALLQQCRELAACLDRCQGVASETQARADSLHAENDSLQLAVQQLAAYAHALAQSQRELQSELSHLEVVGCREPAVFG